MFSFKPRDVYQNAIVMALHAEADNVVGDSNELRQRAMSTITARQQVQKNYFDEKRRKLTEYQVGDMVLVERDLTAMGHSRKLESRFKGPFVVMKILDNDRYELQEVPGTKGSRRMAITVYSVDRIKRWCQLADIDGCETSNGEEEM